MSETVRVRFAPSPTGYLHVGGARTALFNYLFARHSGGQFILRIEDTDRKRFQEGALEEIFDSLEWLGLEWDEGPHVGGDAGPYFQSQRCDLYRHYAQKLVEGGMAYPCFCTAERLDQLRAAQEKKKDGGVTGYDRHCRDLSDTDRVRLLEGGRPHVIRFKVPASVALTFTDLIRGEITYDSGVLDDFVLLKSDGYPTYHLANVIDDHLMDISHIMRGDEWIASTPRHILIYDALGWIPPQFAHLPVILAIGGGKLSKRHGAASVMDYKNGGILSDALVNFLVLLGWAPGGDREILTRKEMVALFGLERITAKASVFDETKLDWMNGHYIRQTGVESLLAPVASHWLQNGTIDPDSTFSVDYQKKIIAMLKERAKRIGDIADMSSYFFKDPEEYDAKAVKKHFKEDARERLRLIADELADLDHFDQTTLESIYRNLAETGEVSAGKFIHPTRLAISGVSMGPGLFEMMETLGKEGVLRRLNRAIKWLNNRSKSNTGA